MECTSAMKSYFLLIPSVQELSKNTWEPEKIVDVEHSEFGPLLHFPSPVLHAVRIMFGNYRNQAMFDVEPSEW